MQGGVGQVLQVTLNNYIIFKSCRSLMHLLLRTVRNRSFLSCFLSLSQNKSFCRTIHMKLYSAYSFSCKSKSFSKESFRTRTHSETEVQGNLEMAHCIVVYFLANSPRWIPFATLATFTPLLLQSP